MGNSSQSYSYDPVGNRLSSLGVPNYNYNSSNELTSSSLGGYTYDANGNTLTDAQGRSFSWDFENRLTQVANPGVGTTTFKYDPFGRRIQKSGPLGTTNYLYDGINLLETLNASGSEIASYANGGDLDQGAGPCFPMDISRGVAPPLSRSVRQGGQVRRARQPYRRH